MRVSPRQGVTVTMPWIVSYKTGLDLFLNKKDWVLETIERQNNKLIDNPPPSPDQIEAWRAEAKRVLPVRLAELAQRHSSGMMET